VEMLSLEVYQINFTVLKKQWNTDMADDYDEL
jgi:hypothetical protein